MNSYLKCFLLVILYNSVFLDCVEFRCDYTYKGIGWFKYHKIPATWYSARSMCHLEGGVLASPTSPELKEAIQSYISNYMNIFTGINSIFSEGHFSSIDGIPLETIPEEWSNFEPNSQYNDENCIRINNGGVLTSVRCDVPHPYVCFREHSEKDVGLCGTPDPEYRLDNTTNKCYKYHIKARSFYSAHFACAAEGGHLVVLNGKEKIAKVKEIFDLNRSKTIGSVVNNFIFVGFHNFFEDNDWRTIHGEPIEEAGFPNFKLGEPNNYEGPENCGSIHSSGLLNDISCHKRLAFICEKDPHYPPVCSDDTTTGIATEIFHKDSSELDVKKKKRGSP